MEKISPKIVKDIEKSRFRPRSRDLCQFLEENLVSEKSLGFGSENLVLEKSISFGFSEFGLGKKYRFRNNWSLKQSLGFGFEKFGIGKKSFSIDFGQNFSIVIQCFLLRKMQL